MMMTVTTPNPTQSSLQSSHRIYS